MAVMKIKGMDSTRKMFDDLGKYTEAIGIEAVRAGAELLADDVRRRLEGNLIGSAYSTGDLLDSFGVTPARVDKNGNIDVKIGFHGYDRKGVPNKLKARAMESGTSKQRKRPFFRFAVNANRRKIKELMERIVYTNWDRIKKG